MAPRRERSIDRKVRLVVDGRPVDAEEGEPIASALLAANGWLFSRSVKYHRPRGPACFARECDGCLMRVDGVPDVMTCATAARDGMRIETQNVVGSAQTDLLSATDWFFPEGINHHELLTKFRPLNRAMQSMARRVAGIGTLPDSPMTVLDAERLLCEVLVVGAGPCGLAIADKLRRLGVDAVVLDEANDAGGHLRFAPARLHDGQKGALQKTAELAAAGLDGDGALRLGTSAIGFFHDAWLASTDEKLVAIDARAVVFATGMREGAGLVAGGDRPGVLTARAFSRLLTSGIVPAKRVAFVGGGAWSDALVSECESRGIEVARRVREADAVRVIGRAKVRGLEVRAGEGTASVDCDAVVTCSPPSAVFETAAQAGASVAFHSNGFFVEATAHDGATGAPHVFAVGECSGVRTPIGWSAQIEGAAARIAKEVR